MKGASAIFLLNESTAIVHGDREYLSQTLGATVYPVRIDSFQESGKL